MRPTMAVILISASLLAGCGESQRKLSAAEIARVRLAAQQAAQAVLSMHSVCKPGEVEVSVRQSSQASSSTCATPHDAPAAVERLLRPRHHK